MAVRTDFVAGEVLAAQDLDDTFASKLNYALPVNAQTGSGASAYTFVLADGLRLTTASNAAAATYTIPPQSSVVWLANSVIRIVNYGAGVVTIAGGAGVTVTNATTTLAQFESAALIRTASNAWTLVPFSGGGNANFSDAATGTYTDSGISYKYITFTGSGTLTVTKAGLADVLVVGGGGSGGTGLSSGGGGAGGHFYKTDLYIPAGAITVVVGAGGAAYLGDGFDTVGKNGTYSTLGNIYIAGGGGGGGGGGTGIQGASGGGGSMSGAAGAPNFSGGTGFSDQGNNGGTGRSSTTTSQQLGGGGGGGGAVGGNASGTTAGSGGAGVSNSITNSAVTRSGGGGGGARSGGTAGTATDGGGNGGNNAAGSNASVNTGGGGGGSGNADISGNGGSGLVIVRVRT